VFINLNNVVDAKSKKFFIEKIDLFNKIIKAFSVKNKLTLENVGKKTEISIIKKIIELNIINSKADLDALQSVLKADKFETLISTANFRCKNDKVLGNILDKFDPMTRRSAQKSSLNQSKPKLVDFFCGAGGLSLGFVQAGFYVDFANDYEDVCVQTYRHNHPEVPSDRVVHGDIRNIVDHLEKYSIEDIDVVIGGPPCQGFSSANQQRVIDDPRNELYKYYIKAIEKIEPKFVVMENVRGMLPYAAQIVEDYQNIGTKNKFKYDVAYKVLISDDFGVSQKRQRLIFIAIRSDISDKLSITPGHIFSDIDKLTLNTKKHILQDALDWIKPLESPRIKNMTEVDDEVTGKKIDSNKFLGNENSYLKAINQGREMPFVFNHKARYTNDINYEIYSKLGQGEDGTSKKIENIMPYKHRNHIFKDKYFKLRADKPSRTITAHLRMDCHSHIHPHQIRSITPREAARIQSFPDDYIFLGPYLKTYMQIGNAVPPLMARGIAKIIKKYIN